MQRAIKAKQAKVITTIITKNGLISANHLNF
jgi:hypothetical protein